MTDLPFDILDHIFGLLRSDPKSLIACMKAHPDFTPIAERHRFYHTIVHTGSTVFPYSFKPIPLIKLIFATPRIVNHVRVLEIELNHRNRFGRVERFLEDIAWLLPRFSVIECLMLSRDTIVELLWQDLPRSFRSAVEDCLHLPTLQEVHVGRLTFPLSILSRHTNINLLSLLGSHGMSEYLDTYPQLKSLSVQGVTYRRPFIAWAKHRIGNLQSLEFDYLNNSTADLDLLKGCSDTLENLHISFLFSAFAYATRYHAETGEVENSVVLTSTDLSSLRHLQYLTIRSSVTLREDWSRRLRGIYSVLPTVFEIVKTAPSLQHLDIDVYLVLPAGSHDQLDKIDFSPLTVLGEVRASFHHIDLYIHSTQRTITLSRIVSLLADYTGLMKLIDQGTLVIHPEEMAPRFLDTVHSKSTLVRHPRLPNHL